MKFHECGALRTKEYFCSTSLKHRRIQTVFMDHVFKCAFLSAHEHQTGKRVDGRLNARTLSSCGCGRQMLQPSG